MNNNISVPINKDKKVIGLQKKIINLKNKEIQDLKQEKLERDIIDFKTRKSETKIKVVTTNGLYLSIFINIMLGIYIVLLAN